jgi:hypothetical protein
MRSLPPEPSSGDKVTADFARELIRAIKERQLLDGPDYALARGPNGTVLKLKQSNQKQHPARVRPWEIHFFPAQTQEDEDFWGVYLPAGSLNIAGEELTPTDSSGTTLVAAGAAYPGYYVIPVASGTSPSAFWLHVYTSESTGGTSYRATVGASDTASPGTSEETLTSIRLCSIASSGAITQLIVGAIALGGGGDSGGGSGGGDVSVGTPKTAATSITYPDSSDTAHPYAIKLTRGYLAASANTLTIDPQDGGTGTVANLTQYIDTVPISSVVTADSLIPSN